ncbi:MAG TPA: GrpB family protein [Polyangiaceae bacterium]
MPAPIEIVDYDPLWPVKFAEERERLLGVLGEWLRGPIEHIGSTAVPGLRAKPVIDVMAGVGTLAASRGAIPVLGELDYQYWPYKSDVMHWFCKPSDEVRTHHLHLVPVGSVLWVERLAFRDRLRADASARSAYTSLKDALASRYREDREAYTEGKTDFVRRLVALELQPTLSKRG